MEPVGYGTQITDPIDSHQISSGARSYGTNTPTVYIGYILKMVQFWNKSLEQLFVQNKKIYSFDEGKITFLKMVIKIAKITNKVSH